VKTNHITRPLLRYHGGKFLLAKWILQHFPQHRVYTETFGGAASVLLQKQRSYGEVYNDLSGDVVNLFRVVRTNGKALKEALHLTPFSRDEFTQAYEPTDDDFERARRTIIRSYQGFGSAGATFQSTGFRANSNRSGTTPAHDWANLPKSLDAIIERLRGVVIENRPAMDVMTQHDSKEALHYVDPPYVLDTRSNGQNTKCYQHELTNSDHVELCQHLSSLKGMVVLSGYQNEIYDSLLSGFTRIDRKAYADGAADRIESLWLNDSTIERQQQLTLIQATTTP
jgi:DNA adenine methylase